VREVIVGGYGGVLWGWMGLCEGELTGKDWLDLVKPGEICVDRWHDRFDSVCLSEDGGGGGFGEGN